MTSDTAGMPTEIIVGNPKIQIDGVEVRMCVSGEISMIGNQEAYTRSDIVDRLKQELAEAYAAVRELAKQVRDLDEIYRSGCHSPSFVLEHHAATIKKAEDGK